MASNRFTRSVATTVAAIAGLLLLAGCGTPAVGARDATKTAATSCPVPAGLVLIVGVHRNEPAPGVPAALACTLQKTITAGHSVSIVADDGNPYVVLPATVLPVSTANQAAEANDIRAGEDTVLADVASAKARTPGANLLAALSVAADEIRSAGISRPTIAVIDSGLSDRGTVSFTEAGMLAANPNQVARYVEDQGALPDLQGTTVDLVGIGYVAPPQQPLDAPQRSAVTQIWAAIATAAGAQVNIVPVPRSGPGPNTTLPTGIVTVPAPNSYRTTTGGTATGPIHPRPGHTTIFDGTSALGFFFNSTQLRDPTTAQAELRPLAAWLAAEPGRSVTLTGTTDSIGTPAYNKTLSQARANTIRALLVTLGAPPAAIHTAGAGYTADPPDITPTGAVNPAKAALNRAVRITPNQ